MARTNGAGAGGQRLVSPADPIAWSVALFLHHYPQEFQGGEIAWRVFWRLFAQIPAVRAYAALHELSTMDYVAAAAWGNRKGADSVRTALERAAFGGKGAAWTRDWDVTAQTIRNDPNLSDEAKTKALEILEKQRG